jgi:hypothetical protein
VQDILLALAIGAYLPFSGRIGRLEGRGFWYGGAKEEAEEESKDVLATI